MFICSFRSYISSRTSSTKFRSEENLNTRLSFISNFKIMPAVKYFVSAWQFMFAKFIITRNKFCFWWFCAHFEMMYNLFCLMYTTTKQCCWAKGRKWFLQNFHIKFIIKRNTIVLCYRYNHGLWSTLCATHAQLLLCMNARVSRVIISWAPCNQLLLLLAH